MGAIIDKFCGGALGGKGWPAGTIQVAELHGEFSFLGLEAIACCCKYRSYLNNSFMADQLKKDLCEGGVCYFSYLLNCGYKSFIWCVCGTTVELEKQRLAYKLERWGVHPVCILKEVATKVCP